MPKVALVLHLRCPRCPDPVLLPSDIQLSASLPSSFCNVVPWADGPKADEPKSVTFGEGDSDSESFDSSGSSLPDLDVSQIDERY